MDQPQTNTAPAGSPADISPALPGSPETQPTEPTAPPESEGPPEVDPYQPNLTPEEWTVLAGEAHMPTAEFQTIFAPARQVATELGGEAVLEALEGDEVLSSYANDPNLYRALGRFGDDIRVCMRDGEAYAAELRQLASECGERLANPVVPELEGQALDAAVDRLVSRYIQDPNARRGFEAAGLFSHPAVRDMLVRMAQLQHRSVGVLSALSQQRDHWRSERDSRREQGQVSAMAGEVRSMSEAEYQHRYGELFDQYQQASVKGRWVDKARIQEQMTTLSKARYGG